MPLDGCPRYTQHLAPKEAAADLVKLGDGYLRRAAEWPGDQFKNS